MGEIKRIVCASCKREWECRVGCGLSHALLKNVLCEFPEEIGDRVMVGPKEEFPMFAFGYHISTCAGCGNVVSIPVLRLEEQNAEYAGPCPICGDTVSLITDIEEAACPVCKSRALQEETEGYWD